MTFTHALMLLFTVGAWNVVDGGMSILLYYQANSYRADGDKQTWAKDHLIRILRIAGGLVVLYISWMMGYG